MANQIVVSSGAKVRDLNDVIIGTSGVLSSLAFNVANGVPKLDVNGKILVSQLPNSVMEYKGTWDASTNTPTLVNGTGNQGDVYLCNVAGTVNFGAGPIAFFVGDQVIYSGTIWQRASGASGTVTSVAITESGDSLNITGSPITTSGTINIGFNGTNLQYINGAGDLTTFPSLTGYVPYTGATGAVNLGAYDLTVQGLTIGKGLNSLSNNTALGYRALFHTTTGNYNTAVGYESSHNTTTGQYNTTLGQSALFTNTTGSQNTALGLNALLSNTTGGSNVVVGLDGLQHNTTGSSNTAIGYNAGSHITGGSTPNTTASSSVYIGRDSKAKVDGGVNEIVIGYNAVGNGSNTVTFGNTSTTANYFTGSVNGGSFVKSGGTSSQFLKADGSVDSSTYLTTSAASSTYVPYTGATGNVNLGLFSLTSNTIKVIGDNSTYGGTLSIKQNNVTSLIGTGYTELFGKTNRLGISFGAGSIALLSNSILTLERTYTLPDASGTLPLLESTQTFSGDITFSNDLLVDGVRVGNGSGGSNNARFGALSYMSNTTGSYNTAIGTYTLNANTTGSYNTALGNSALYNNTTASNNTAIGGNALANNTTSSNNTAVGFVSLGQNTIGTQNSALGASSLTLNTIGSNNIAIGYTSLNANTTGSQNTSIGVAALTLHTTGTYNTAIGYGAGGSITTGSNNTIVGYYAGTATMSNNIVLADGAGNVKYQWDGTSNNFDGILKSSGALWVNTSAGSPNSMIILAQVAGTQPPTLGNSSIGVNTTDFRFTATTTSTNFKSFSFSTSSLTNNSVRTYSMPDADGTLALGTGTTNYHAKFTGTNTIGNSLIWDNGTNVGIGNTNTSYTLDVSGTLRNTTSAYFATTSGSVGIGTVSPSDKFSVDAGAGNVVTSSFFNSTMTAGQSSYIEIGKNYSSTYNTGELAFKYVGDGSSSNIVSLGFYGAGNKLNVLGNGNVGIAVTPSSWSSSFKALQVGTASLSQNNNTTAYIGSNWVSESGGDKYITTNAAAIYAQNTGAHIWYTAPSGTAGDAMTFTERMRITSGGNVGIGMAGYSQTRLTVRGVDSSSSNYVFRLENAATSGIIEIRNDGQIGTNLGTGTVYSTSGILSVVSDMTLKIEDGFIDSALDKVLKLKPRYFHWKEESKLPTDLRQLGFYAQEVNEALGEEAANTPKENEYFGINDRAIIAFLTKAIQELSAQNEDLKARLDNAGL